MNVMVLDWDHRRRARMHPDNYTNKLTTEAVQLLNGALHDNGLEEYAFYDRPHDHPWLDWAGESVHNWFWLYQHAESLAREFDYRYPYSDSHSSMQKAEKNWVESDILIALDSNFDTTVGLTEFPICTGDFEPSFGQDEPVKAYQEYVATEKAQQDWCTWSGGSWDWIQDWIRW